MYKKHGEKMDCVWFRFLSDIKESMCEHGILNIVQKEIVQDVKTLCLENLNMRGDMRNMREKHIPQVHEIYKCVFRKYISLE